MAQSNSEHVSTMCQGKEKTPPGSPGEPRPPEAAANSENPEPRQEVGSDKPQPEEQQSERSKDVAVVVEEKKEHTKQKRSFLEGISYSITAGMENFFENHGRRVARYPHQAAAICFVVSMFFSFGNYNFSTEVRPYKLWLPQDSEFIKILDWQTENFPINFRFHSLVWESDNILTAHGIQEMWKMHIKVNDMVVPHTNITWGRVCAQVPTLNAPEEEEEYDYDDFDYGSFGRKKRATKNADLSLSLSRNDYCDSVSSLPSLCFESSLLEIWGLNEDIIMGLTDQQIVNDINSATVSAVFGYKKDFLSHLGSVEKDESGRIISAKAATHFWITHLDLEAIERGESNIDEGTGDVVDAAGLLFESAWVNTVLNDTERHPNVNVYAQAASSFGKVSEASIWSDVKWLVFGMCLMFSFINSTMGKRNLVQQRPLLSLFGLLSCGMSVAISYGLCSAFSVPYGPVNSILPILLIGLGVDDMFVIMAAWEELAKKKPYDTDLVERAAKTMRHAGVAITVTSLTDVTAFIVGASTDLPALQSFCLYAAAGIFAVYVLQSTFFLAWLVRDEERMTENRNGMIWCIQHKNWKPNACSQRDLLNDFFKNVYARYLVKTPVRIIVLIISVLTVGTSVWATTNLYQDFNPMWFVPNDSFVYKWFEASLRHFPSKGEKGYIYFENAKLPEDFPALQKLVNDLDNSEAVESVSAWFTEFDTYTKLNKDFANKELDGTLLQNALAVFLKSSTGGVFLNDINFAEETVKCEMPAPNFNTFRISLIHKPAPVPAIQSKYLSIVRNIIDESAIQGARHAWAQAYSIWETNEVVGYELVRNLILAGVVVGIITLILLASARCAFLVLLCVAFTVIGVTGIMWVWGLTVDTVSCIAIVLAIGLSVDYAAHIAHAFLTARGEKTRIERAEEALRTVGPAVTHGAVSTFLAFSLLGMSSSHVFLTFFKIFTPSVAFGYFYGIAFLPVVLSYMGPAAYAGEDDEFYYEEDSMQDSQKTHDNPAFVPDTV
ncbi:unnamed protein product [Meganyctiphanes norvegica]|uniref:SSD domain-containing protein n=1 Tax=Meganyctiphanes norvegica TaxID=48144 RepID=A0AAV2PIB1_MEGNR